MNARQRYDSAELDRYWHGVSERHIGASDEGLELICYAGMPSWFNHLIHHFQVYAFENVVAGESFASSRVLDIGTGIGRWARWYASWPDARVTGIDLEPARLQQAARLGGGVRYAAMRADDLQFEDGSFDVINSVTVLQHVPDAVKHAAVAEMSRVATTDARIVIFELTDQNDDAPHVFPWAARQWERELSVYGFRPIRCVGTEYIPLLRALKHLHRRAQGRGDLRADIDAIKAGRRTMGDRIRLAALRTAVTLSYPIEHAAMVAAPRSAARITGWLYRRGA